MPAPKPICGLQYELTTAPLVEAAVTPPRGRDWPPICAAAFIACLAALVVGHAATEPHDAVSPDFKLVEASR